MNRQGEENGRAKLSASDVMTIRLMSEVGMSKKALSEKYDVHYRTIYRIIKRRLWRHI